MIAHDRVILLTDGTELTAAQIFEAFLLLSQAESPFPLFTPLDEQKAAVLVTFEALEWQREQGVA